MRLFALALVTGLLVTGCTTKEPSYDPIELIEYQNCLNNPPPYFDGVFTPPRNWAEQACESKRPVLK